MKNLNSPSNIELLLHCHTKPEPHPRIEVPAVHNGIQELLNCGAIEQEKHKIYRTTPMGKAWVQALCNVPPPKQVYVDEAGKVLQ